jgi:exosortase
LGIGHLLGGLALALAGVAVTSDAWRDILAIGLRDEESSQVFLAPIVAGYLAWVRRDKWTECRPRATWVGPVVVAAGWAISTFGYQQAIQSFWHGGAVLVAVGCFLSITGIDVFWKFVPVFAVLVFMIPVPGMARQRVAIPLQLATAQMTQFFFDLIGIDVQRAGSVLTIRGAEVAVAEACNGMRMVFALVLVSFAYAFSTGMAGWVRALILILSPIVAIFCNVLRLIPTVWLYGYSSQETAAWFHDVSGWAMLPLAFLLLLAVGWVARWVMVPTR